MLHIFSRRKPLFVAVLVAAAIFAAEALSSSNIIQQRPNIIVIQPDDHLFLEEWNPPGRFQIQQDISTSTIPPSSWASITSSTMSISSTYTSPVPNINRIRNHGLEMTNAYAASTMCGTSRYSTITGRLPSRSSHGRQIDKDSIERSILVDGTTSSLFLRDVIIPKTKLADATAVEDPKDCTSNNLAAVLQQNGYSTGVVGKWHLDATHTDRGEGLYDNYAKVQEDVKRCGFDFAEAIYRENLVGDKNVNVDGIVVTHNMEHITAEAIRFIQESANDNQNGNEKNRKKKERQTSAATDTNNKKPFFLYFNPTVPHSSGDVTDALWTADCKDTVQGRLSEIPFIPYGMTASGDTVGNAGCRKYRKTVLERAAAAAASIGNSKVSIDDDKLAGAIWVDDAIGSLFETLEALNILNNTLVLFQLDHGMDAKGSLFEGGSRIVQFIHYPDRIKIDEREEPTAEQQGWKFEGLVSTIDIAPTLMDLAGVPLIQSTGNETVNANENPAQHRYDMDGKSWFSDVVAANTDAISPSEEKLQKQDQQKNINYNYFEERCLFVEEGLDRSVRCGCYKYIYISDTTKGFTVTEARKYGVNLDTHNFYYLCDENTGDYINSPESSPELWSISSDSTVANGNRITNILKTKLKNKIKCLLKQTDPSNKYPDYKTDCDLSLFDVKVESVTVENNSSSVANVSESVENDFSSVGTSESIIADFVDSKAPIESPSDDSPTYLESNEPTLLDITVVSEDLESEEFGEGRVPFLRSPTTSSIVDIVPKYVIIVASLLLLVAPCFLYWMYREFCRRVVVGSRADRYPLKVKQVAQIKDSNTNVRGTSCPESFKDIEKKLLQAAIASKSISAVDLEVGSSIIHKTGSEIAEEFGSDYTRSSYPMIWRKLADEIKRQKNLRAKWNVYTVSGVVIGTSSSSVGTDLTSGTLEPTLGTLLDDPHQNLGEKVEKDRNEILEENPNEDPNVPDLGKDDTNMILGEESNKEQVSYSDDNSEGETDEGSQDNGNGEVDEA